MAEKVTLCIKCYKEWSWKFVFGFFNWWHLPICMIFLVLINCILEIQNSWGRQNGIELHINLWKPQSFVWWQQLSGVHPHCRGSAARRTRGLTSKSGTCFRKPLSAWLVGSGQREAPRCQLQWVNCGCCWMGRLTVPGCPLVGESPQLSPQNVPYHPRNPCVAVTTTWNKIPVIHISLMTAVAYCPGDGWWWC